MEASKAKIRPPWFRRTQNKKSRQGGNIRSKSFWFKNFLSCFTQKVKILGKSSINVDCFQLSQNLWKPTAPKMPSQNPNQLHGISGFNHLRGTHVTFCGSSGLYCSPVSQCIRGSFFHTRLLSQHVCEACGQTIPSAKDTPGPSSMD